MRDLWAAAGLTDIDTRTLTVARTYADFDDLWSTLQGGPSAGQALAAMSAEERSRFRELLRARLQPADNGPITQKAQANAILGTVPGR
jgi:uncharacterized membrane protein